jgi:hypothetical protein
LYGVENRATTEIFIAIAIARSHGRFSLLQNQAPV